MSKIPPVTRTTLHFTTSLCYYFTTMVELLKSYCLPFLLYGSEAVSLSSTNVHLLETGELYYHEQYTESLVRKDDSGSVWQRRQFRSLHSIQKLDIER